MTALTIVEILEYYDCPLVLLAEDEAGNLYLADSTSEFDALPVYRIVKVDMDQARRLHQGTSDLRSVLIEAGSAEWWLSAPGKDGDSWALTAQDSLITESALFPDPGYTVEGPWNSHTLLKPGARTLGLDQPLTPDRSLRSGAAAG